MKTHHHTETWLFYGISDLYFSFHSEEWVFDYHSAFFAIMALEKHLKAFLIWHRKKEYEELGKKEANEKVLKIAKSYGHDFPELAKKADEYLSNNEITNLLNMSYDGYNGGELLEVLRDAYMETRYPTSRNVAQSFPVGEPGIYHNPLASSGLHKFIQTFCETLAKELAGSIDFEKLLSEVKDQYKHLEPFNRFSNIYLKEHWQ
ncbi:MAG: hypothetical protein QGD92_07635 [Gammaproteobacteria bacterium]|nr:hypothetical protein [Gammaproteobacteria bacterium]